MFICSYCQESVTYPIVLDCQHMICTVCMYEYKTYARVSQEVPLQQRAAALQSLQQGSLPQRQTHGRYRQREISN